MSTNYYFKPFASNPLAVFGTIHIGKQSGGWVFSFQGYNHEGGAASADVDRTAGLSVQVETPKFVVKSAADWREVLTGGVIENEYDELVTLHDFFSNWISSKEDTFNGRKLRVHAEEYGSDPERNWVDSEGYSFSGYEFC